MVDRRTWFTLGTARGQESCGRAGCNRYPKASPATRTNAGLASNPQEVSCTERNRWTLGRRSHRCTHSRIGGNPRQQPSTTGSDRSTRDQAGDPAVAKSREVSPRPFSCLDLTPTILALRLGIGVVGFSEAARASPIAEPPEESHACHRPEQHDQQCHHQVRGVCLSRLPLDLCRQGGDLHGESVRWRYKWFHHRHEGLHLRRNQVRLQREGLQLNSVRLDLDRQGIYLRGGG